MPGTMTTASALASVSVSECINQCNVHLAQSKELLMFSLGIMSVLWLVLISINKFNILKSPGLKDKITLGILWINATQTILLFLLL